MPRSPPPAAALPPSADRGGADGLPRPRRGGSPVGLSARSRPARSYRASRRHCRRAVICRHHVDRSPITGIDAFATVVAYDFTRRLPHFPSFSSSIHPWRGAGRHGSILPMSMGAIRRALSPLSDASLAGAATGHASAPLAIPRIGFFMLFAVIRLSGAGYHHCCLLFRWPALRRYVCRWLSSQSSFRWRGDAYVGMLPVSAAGAGFGLSAPPASHGHHYRLTGGARSASHRCRISHEAGKR